jgi:hypothetical protein
VTDLVAVYRACPNEEVTRRLRCNVVIGTLLLFSIGKRAGKTTAATMMWISEGSLSFQA